MEPVDDGGGTRQPVVIFRYNEHTLYAVLIRQLAGIRFGNVQYPMHGLRIGAYSMPNNSLDATKTS